jgi:hypothetical protein
MPAFSILEKHIDPMALSLSPAFRAELLARALGWPNGRPTQGTDLAGADLLTVDARSLPMD